MEPCDNDYCLASTMIFLLMHLLQSIPAYGLSGLFFVWACEHCGTAGYVEYEDGDDPQIIAGQVVLAHEKEAKEGCEIPLRIFDHRGMEQPDSELFLASRRVK